MRTKMEEIKDKLSYERTANTKLHKIEEVLADGGN